MKIGLFGPAAVVEPTNRFTRKIKQPRASRTLYWFFHDMVIHRFTLPPAPHGMPRAGLRKSPVKGNV